MEKRTIHEGRRSIHLDHCSDSDHNKAEEEGLAEEEDEGPAGPDIHRRNSLGSLGAVGGRDTQAEGLGTQTAAAAATEDTAEQSL